MRIVRYQALSGPVTLGEAMAIGNRAAVNMIEDNGGVLGQPVGLDFVAIAFSPTDDGVIVPSSE